MGIIVVMVLELAVGSSMSQAQSTTQLPGEMLQDGLEALGDHESGLATQLFEQLILAFPGTPEAQRAERELSLRDSAEHPDADTASREDVPPNGNQDLPALRMKFAVEAGDRVFFAENSAVIGGRARALLENQARWLQSHRELKITVIGRADDGGPEDEAHLLSSKRAEAVREKLVAGGVAASRILIDARGSGDPVATCHTVLCQAQNRHAETSIGGGIVSGAGDDMVRGASIRSRGATISGAAGGVTVSR